MSEKNTQGMVFDIQPCSIHDGPGIRTTVFLNGCYLRCKWCQNPESFSLKPVLSYSADKCTGCGMCLTVCPNNAITLQPDGKTKNNRELCDACGACVTVCPANARSIIGKSYTAQEILEIVEKDRVFYEGSGGGVTLSGGEILFQNDFAREVLKLCREAGLSTAVETTGHADWEKVRDVLQYADVVLYDLKHMDSDRHKEATGVGNRKILENIKLIKHELKKEIYIRIPVIPGFNDSSENLMETATFIREELGQDTKINLLPYHRLGLGKWELLEQPVVPFEAEPPTGEQMEYAKNIFSLQGLTAGIGG